MSEDATLKSIESLSTRVFLIIGQENTSLTSSYSFLYMQVLESMEFYFVVNLFFF